MHSASIRNPMPKGGDTMECPVCFTSHAREIDSAGGLIQILCERCGGFCYDGESWQKLKLTPERKRAVISGWIWEQNLCGSTPTITAKDNLDTLLSLAPLPFMGKLERLLVHLTEQSDEYGTPLDFSDPMLSAMLQTYEQADINYLAQFLVDKVWLERLETGKYRLNGAGYLKADELKQSVTLSTQGFVAMWFDGSMNSAWNNGLRPGVLNAGYKPFRIDHKEHANKICDEIISEIRRSRFLVADYTGHRGGVYYEAGFAAGKGLPVILTCRKDALKDLHFDIRQYNCIDWQTPDELAKRLSVRIEAVLGDGPLKCR